MFRSHQYFASLVAAGMVAAMLGGTQRARGQSQPPGSIVWPPGASAPGAGVLPPPLASFPSAGYTAPPAGSIYQQPRLAATDSPWRQASPPATAQPSAATPPSSEVSLVPLARPDIQPPVLPPAWARIYARHRAAGLGYLGGTPLPPAQTAPPGTAMAPIPAPAPNFPSAFPSNPAPPQQTSAPPAPADIYTRPPTLQERGVPFLGNVGAGGPGRMLPPAAEPTRDPAAAPAPAPSATTPSAGEQHPLISPLRMAQIALDRLNQTQDMSYVLHKRERHNGAMEPYHAISMKIRHEPFSVYLQFLAPEDAQGREAIYVAGRNGGNILAHGTGMQRFFGTVSLAPTSGMAMQGNRYPITRAGLKNIVLMLMEIGQREMQYGGCQVQHYPQAMIDGRACRGIEVVHPQRQAGLQYHATRIFFDEQLALPVRIELYDWPDRPGGAPVLDAEYTFSQIRLNNGFTDLDFDPRNPQYNFPEGRRR